MPTPQRLDADALASELAKLPSLTTAASSHLDAVQIAIARAVASGQSADEIALALGVPAGWQGIDLAAKSVAPKFGATPAASVAVATPHAPAPVAAPAWIGKIVPLALNKAVTTRVAVLDREPTAMGGLELPSWARALAPSASYGPITVSSPSLQIAVEKWIIIFHFSETVEFVRSGTVLCVVPLSIFHFGHPTQISILSGSAWIAAQPLSSSAPSDGFAGISIQSGELSSDQPLTFSGTTVTIPATANISLTLIPAASSPEIGRAHV